MNCIHNKMILYMLIIASGIDFILPWPTFQRNKDKQSILPETRSVRQVVQPSWLNLGQREPPVDPTVYVNDKALEEAEEIRKTIQKAVDEDTYVVQEPDPNTVMQPAIKSPNESNPPERPFPSLLPLHELPNWYVQMQNLWRNWSQNLFKGFQVQQI